MGTDLRTERLWAALVSRRWLGRYATLPYVPYVASAAVVGLATLTGFASAHYEVMFLTATVFNAVMWGRWPSLLSVALSIIVVDFFFIPPVYSFVIEKVEDVVDLIIFSVLALLCSSLAASFRRYAVEMAAREEMTAHLYDFSRRLIGIGESDELFTVIVEHLGAVLQRPTMLLLPAQGRLTAVASRNDAPPLTETDIMEAEVLWRGPAAALDAVELRSGWRFKSLRAHRAAVALVAVRGSADIEDGYLQSLLDQAALAIERLQLAKAYEDARVKASTESLREALINSIAHDLQTPLASVLGSATALQNFESLYDKAARAQLVAAVRDGAERLNHIIQNIVDLSRIRAGTLNPRLEPIELHDIVNSALHRSRARLADRKVTVDLPADLPMLKLDLFLMEHALVNLMENAGKYTPKGAAIGIRAVVRGDEVVLDIADRGAGIAPDDLPRIFERFYRGEPTDSRPAGAGLGLTICRAFIEANGGRIEAYSAGIGQGTTFTIALPVPADLVPEKLTE